MADEDGMHGGVPSLRQFRILFDGIMSAGGDVDLQSRLDALHGADKNVVLCSLCGSIPLIDSRDAALGVAYDSLLRRNCPFYHPDGITCTAEDRADPAAVLLGQLLLRGE